MKILIEYAPGASYYVRSGWRRALKACGHKVYMWLPEKMNINDLVYELGEFDLFLGNTYTINRAMDKWIRSNPNMKVVLFGSNWGELTDSMDSQKYPIVKVTEEEKQILGKLYNDIKKPDLVHIHITDSYLEYCMGGWRSLGIPITGILNAADTFIYHGVQPDPAYLSDVSIVSGYWPYKAINLDKYIVKLCNEKFFTLNIKVFGYGWNVPQYIGGLDEGKDAIAMASAKISPTISEPHSVDFGYDVTERTFKTPVTGSLCISDEVDLSEIFPKGVVPTFNTYKQFQELICWYIVNENDRKLLVEQQQAIILANHTYFDRMAKVFSCLDLHKEENELLMKKTEILGLTSQKCGVIIR